MEATEELEPRDRVYRYAWVGGDEVEAVTYTVLRVNRQTLTVRCADGDVTRIPIQEFEGKVTWDET